MQQRLTLAPAAGEIARIAVASNLRRMSPDLPPAPHLPLGVN
jgi:hypothetical protein